MAKSIGEYKIGQLISILKKEYEDISASSLRFWEKEGLIIPSGSGKGAGTHRIYTDEDIEIIRYIKECTNNKVPISEIKKYLESWEKTERDIVFLRAQTNTFKRMRKLMGYLQDVLMAERSKNFYEYIYPEDTFTKILNTDEKSSSLIKTAEEYKLIFPIISNKTKMYNQMDFTIMKLIIGSGAISLNKYNKLSEMVEYLQAGLGLNMGIILPAITALSELAPIIQKVKVESTDLWLTSALLYLETIYYEEYRAKK
ncbi:MAG: MerR family transcriptional regulator [Candidatus Omnitrophota bacterium]